MRLCHDAFNIEGAQLMRGEKNATALNVAYRMRSLTENFCFDIDQKIYLNSSKDSLQRSLAANFVPLGENDGTGAIFFSRFAC